MEELVLYDGKYRFYIDELDVLRCDRYGEIWRDFIGDKAVWALYEYALEMQNKMKMLEKEWKS